MLKIVTKCTVRTTQRGLLHKDIEDKDHQEELESTVRTCFFQDCQVQIVEVLPNPGLLLAGVASRLTDKIFRELRKQGFTRPLGIPRYPYSALFMEPSWIF